MESVEFNATVGSDQIIRPPTGVQIPEGQVHVVVSAGKADVPRMDDRLKRSREWLLGLARESENDPTDLPSDMAEHHDFYAHGKPKS